MKPEQIHLIRKSFTRLEQRTHLAALVFYQQLFQLDPSLRSLFHTDIEVQAAKLMDMLGLTISLLDRPAALREELKQLGARHTRYGVETHHYETVGRALLEMLAIVLHDDFSPALRLAWTDLYGFIADAMLHGAAQIDPHPATPASRHDGAR